ncbi:MAG: thioesterase family protein [Actinomycetota bacterium]|nr:thioesterase family protein [Actinomycetota bacterium]
MGQCDPGLRHHTTFTVTADATAIAMGSGDVPVLATPKVLALAEHACVAAVGPDVPDGQTTLGTHVELEHDKPSPVGATVEVEATLIGHHGRRLEFNVTLRQDGEVVATVRHRRVLVDRDRFLAKLEA